MADILTIAPEDFLKAVAELRKVESQLNQYKAELTNRYLMMAKCWKGKAGRAFDGCAQQLLKYFEINIANLGQLVADIEKVNLNMDKLEQAVTEMFNSLNLDHLD